MTNLDSYVKFPDLITPLNKGFSIFQFCIPHQTYITMHPFYKMIKIMRKWPPQLSNKRGMYGQLNQDVWSIESEKEYSYHTNHIHNHSHNNYVNIYNELYANHARIRSTFTKNTTVDQWCIRNFPIPGTKTGHNL